MAIVGGGLAGMAAALTLAESGRQVDLFEQRRRLGGRVASFHDPQTGQSVDLCMHVAMGCCTEFLDFIRRAGVEDCFERHRRLTFIGPEGEECPFTSWPWLPAPLHLLPGFARLRYLTFGERWNIARCLVRLARLSPDCLHSKTMAGDWLREQGQSPRMIDRFWSVVLVSALGDTVDRVDLTMARKVLVDGFLDSVHGYEVLTPRLPLGEIFDVRLAERLRELGVTLHLATPVRSVVIAEGQARELVLAGGERREFDRFIVAVPWTTIGRLFPPEQLALLHSNWSPEAIESSAITAVHLWFDREITPLAHAALVGRTSQWLFSHGASEPADDSDRRFHYQVVISASHHLTDVARSTLLEQVLIDVRTVWPEAREARLLHQRIVTERNAVFAVTPDSSTQRPEAATSVENLVLAGDWIRSDWPATMEAAIRSGYEAARLAK